MILLLLACTDYTVKGDPDVGGDAVHGPHILLTPEDLDFGAVAPGDVVEASLTVGNDGDHELHLGRLAVLGSGAFTLLETLDGATLAPGETRDLPIAFAPALATNHATVEVESDDPGNPTAVASLSGEGLYPQLLVWPSAYDFGGALPDCPAEVSVELQNIGGAPLEVSSVVVVGDDFAVTTPTSLPFTIPPGEVVVVTGRYTADALEAAGTLYVDSNDPQGAYASPWSGHPAEDSMYEEVFRQGIEGITGTDIDVFVDQSCSMDDDQRNLSTNFATFYGALESAGLDWQLMVTNNDDGCHSGGYFTTGDPDPSGFATTVSRGGGNWTEAGLTVSSLALGATGAGECNEGFLREGASTVVILVSDEPEQSREPWSTYVASMLAVDPLTVIVSVVGDLPRGCATAAPGVGYVEAALATGGTDLSICSADWGEYGDTIAALASSTLRAAFPLANHPDPSRISVTVNDAPDSTWAYDPYGNAIVFPADRLPAPGALIDVVYYLHTCEG